ncbi:hypothetical protein BD410DRAFT_800323 [Rickenella mellea]|uniref:Uncharacterized protein n=1 Tax=Rickenella mellea TaxID=50990 RepID=A0A4Y7QFN0_9AGAM|nr:hypothetical protein BD410DRAFT_800323 [Rickenella mellea]
MVSVLITTICTCTITTSKFPFLAVVRSRRPRLGSCGCRGLSYVRSVGNDTVVLKNGIPVDSGDVHARRGEHRNPHKSTIWTNSDTLSRWWTTDAFHTECAKNKNGTQQRKMGVIHRGPPGIRDSYDTYLVHATRKANALCRVMVPMVLCIVKASRFMRYRGEGSGRLHMTCLPYLPVPTRWSIVNPLFGS